MSSPEWLSFHIEGGRLKGAYVEITRLGILGQDAGRHGKGCVGVLSLNLCPNAHNHETESRKAQKFAQRYLGNFQIVKSHIYGSGLPTVQ